MPIKFTTLRKDNRRNTHLIQSNASTKKTDSLYTLSNSINVIVVIIDSHYCLLKNESKMSITNKVNMLE